MRYGRKYAKWLKEKFPWLFFRDGNDRLLHQPQVMGYTSLPRNYDPEFEGIGKEVEKRSIRDYYELDESDEKQSIIKKTTLYENV